MELIKITMEVLSPSLMCVCDDNDYGKLNKIFVDVINQLCNFNSKWNVEGMDVSLSIAYLHYQSDNKKMKKTALASGQLVIEARCELNEYIDTESKRYCQEMEEDSKSIDCYRQLFEKNFFVSLSKRVTDFILCINLAYPGVLGIINVEMSYNGLVYEEISDLRLGMLSGIYFEQDELKMPIMSLLKIDDCWKWISSRTDFFEGMGEAPIDRALNAMTYLISPDGYDEIFYAMIGLEALYTTDKSTSILEQMRRKVELIFGKIPGLRKKIANMYNVRSELMHGTLPFPGKYYVNDATDAYEKFLFNDYIETVRIAIILLIGTIQKFIINDANQLVSEYKIDFIRDDMVN